MLGFYKGLSANLIRVTPATMITFLVYEHVSHFLLNFRSQGLDSDTTLPCRKWWNHKYPNIGRHCCKHRCVWKLNVCNILELNPYQKKPGNKDKYTGLSYAEKWKKQWRLWNFLYVENERGKLYYLNSNLYVDHFL